MNEVGECEICGDLAALVDGICNDCINIDLGFEEVKDKNGH